jgi:AcrR family transcriptional regulator
VESPSLPARPLRRDAERNRLVILEAARGAFADLGLDVTMDEIAARAGVGVATVYRRFPDKALLVEDLFEHRLAEIEDIAEECLADEDPWAGLAGFLERTMLLVTCDRGLSEMLAGRAYGCDRVTSIRARIAPMAEALLRRAQAAGVVRADLAPSDLPLMNIMMRSVADYTATADRQVWRRALTILLDGIRTRRDAPTPLPVEALSYAQVDDAMRGACAGRPRPGPRPRTG